MRLGLTAGGVFVAVLLFRLSTVSITNDDYLHLALAQQVLLGDVPVRDFIDPGEFLFYSVSAAAQVLFGHHLLSEVLLDVLLLAVGYTLVFVLAYEASRSYAVGLVVTTVAVLLMPRLYGYPKIVLYAVGLSLMWRYIERQDTRRLVLLAGWSAVAFLFRHDHGASIGAASCVAVALAHRAHGWRVAARRVMYVSAVTAGLLVPFFLFLQVNGGIVGYVRTSLATGRAEYERTVGPYPRFRPMLASPRVSVRWAAGVAERERRTLEDRFRLAAPEDRRDNTWQYDLTDTSTGNIAALVDDPAVDDTAGVDRSRFTVTAQTLEPNVLAWFYYLAMLLPPLAAVTLAWTRDGSGRAMEHEGEKMASAVVLAAAMQPFLLRSASLSAVAETTALTAVLGAWLLRRGLASWRPLAAWPMARVALTCGVLAGTLAAASGSDGAYALQRLLSAREADGAGPIGERLAELRRSSPPFADAGARYVFDCTDEGDRLLVTGYAPDLHYQSGRGFAGGRPYFLSTFALPEHERLSLARLMQQRVPIVLASGGTGGGFAQFPLIDGYLREHYQRAGEIQFRDRTYTVLADGRIPPDCRYGAEGLPCFRRCATGVLP